MGRDRQLGKHLFVSGGTGYMGLRLLPMLVARGHRVRALARGESASKLPVGCETVIGNALEAGHWCARVAPADTFVHLVGVSRPAPWKGAEFRRVDLASVRASAAAARDAGVAHFIYVSVAHPAPVMKSYIEVREECEQIIAAAGLKATILRPWYVLGPGHRWPYALLPFYRLAERVPPLRDGARRLGLVTLEEMSRTLLGAVENPAAATRIIEVPGIRAGVVGDAAAQAVGRVP